MSTTAGPMCNLGDDCFTNAPSFHGDGFGWGRFLGELSGVDDLYELVSTGELQALLEADPSGGTMHDTEFGVAPSEIRRAAERFMNLLDSNDPDALRLRDCYILASEDVLTETELREDLHALLEMASQAEAQGATKMWVQVSC